ncbi:MAG: DNA repair protein RecN [Oscillospiraceae bacterium]|nr:DNA repair protein RecN [Oscillospiraceae bacterium]
MLCELIIENVAVIEKAIINFKDGFTCLTGETGAGKSIIIDSINAIMGERMSKNIVRTGADKASIVAVFENLEQSIIDKAAQMDIDLQDECIVQRQITAEGKSTARINAVPYPVSVLKMLFNDAINIHGQHDSQSLLTPSKHIGILDSFGTDTAIKAAYSQFYSEYTALDKQIKELESIDKDKRNTLDLLTYQVQEIEDAAISADEEEQLNNDKQLIKNAEKIIGSLSDAYSYLFGDDESLGALSALQEASMSTDRVSGFADNLKEIAEKLNDAAAIAQDAGFELKSFIDDFDVDISDIDAIEERLDIYYKLKRKYGPEVEDVLRFYEKSKKELEMIEFAREKLDELYHQRKVILDKLTISADRLTQNRKDVFEKLAGEIQHSLEFLNMPDVKLYLSCENKPFGADGQDNIEFMISTNRGENAKPMAKIASGGELSRIMLAIKSVLAEKEDTHTLIFDEIDTGVSGSAAMKIGKLLKQTSNGKQVLCVTHSAQIAAFADNHLFIEKSTRGDSTYTSVTLLSEADREREVARIISGDNISNTALLNAREMIALAKNS